MKQGKIVIKVKDGNGLYNKRIIDEMIDEEIRILKEGVENKDMEKLKK
jgi:3-hydroxyacyl-CoA dehydrogenase